MFVKHRFELDSYVEDYIRSLVPKFGYDGFGELVFYRTYSRTKKDGGQEDWGDVVIRATNGTFSIRKDYYLKNYIPWDEQFWQNYAKDFALAMFEMEWMPPGRGLWAMGTDFVYERGSMALYNCFSPETVIITDTGLMTMEEASGQHICVRDHEGIYREATVKYFGEQELQRVKFAPMAPYHRSNISYTYDVTKDHRWILANGKETTDLQFGQCVRVRSVIPPEIDFDSQEYIDGYAHGIVFGDGTRQTACPNRFSVRLCKDPHRRIISSLKNCQYYKTSSQPPSYGGDVVVNFVDETKNWKEIPQGKQNLTYLRGFIDGWIEADASISRVGTKILSSQNHEAIEWLMQIAPAIGYTPSGLFSNDKETNFGKRKRALLSLSLSEREIFFRVIDITPLEGKSRVYCVIQPETESFTLAGGIPTGNCAYTKLMRATFPSDLAWLMDSLMHGVGVGFEPVRDKKFRLYRPKGKFDFIIPDTREGWCEATRLLAEAYCFPDRKAPYIIYDRIRLAGLLIKGFGGVSSGPEPLIEFHQGMIEEFERYSNHRDELVLMGNIANRAGVCVVAGNVRRSAELFKGRVTDRTFLDLKNFKINPDRKPFGWMSNNSAAFYDDEDFDMLGEIAKRVIHNGEPGVINMRNMKYGRLGKRMRGLRYDRADGFNPCGEIGLENKETCNVAETCPTVCRTIDRWYKACEYATMYTSTVSLLPTHQVETNRVVARNRRIGVSIIDFSGWKHNHGVHKVIKWLRAGYNIVTETNKWANSEAGVPEAIRKTTIKPGGTGPKLPGKTPGMGHPTHRWTLRRIMVKPGSPFHEVLVRAGIPYEPSVYGKNTDVFEYPIIQGPAPPATEVSLWEQANNLVLLQSEWADNAVSNTLYFKPKWELSEVYENDPKDIVIRNLGFTAYSTIISNHEEEFIIPDEQKYRFKYSETLNGESILTEVKIYEYNPNHEEHHIEPVLSSVIRNSKSIALLPHTPNGVYPQTPEEGISEEEYHRRKAEISPIDWTELTGSDGTDELYCSSESCEMPITVEKL